MSPRITFRFKQSQAFRSIFLRLIKTSPTLERLIFFLLSGVTVGTLLICRARESLPRLSSQAYSHNRYLKMNSIRLFSLSKTMNSLLRRNIVLAAFLTTCFWLVSQANAHDIAKEMRDSANLFIKSLDDDQAKALQFKFEDDLRKAWHFIPKERKGLGLKQMKPHQRGLAMVLVQTALSHEGFATSMQIMAMEQVLRDLENNSLKRDPAKYHLFLFGTPSADSSWGWRVEGHHLSISVTVADGKNVVIAPAFLGANPAVVKSGPLAGTSVLGDMEAKGRELDQAVDE